MRDMPIRRVRVAAALVALVAAALLVQPATARAETVNTTISVPASVVPDPCAGGALVNLHGLLHIVIAYTADNRGGYHTDISTNFEGVSGERLFTGETYRATESTSWTTYLREDDGQETKVVSSTLVSQSATDNYVMHMTLHVRISGSVPTVTASNVVLECRG